MRKNLRTYDKWKKKANIQTCSPCFRLHLHRYFGKCGFFYAFLSFESMKTDSLKNSFWISFTYRIVTQNLRSSETKGGSGKIWLIRSSLTLNNTLIPTNYLGSPPHTHTSVIHVDTNSNYLLLVSEHYCVVTFTCPRL